MCLKLHTNLIALLKILILCFPYRGSLQGPCTSEYAALGIPAPNVHHVPRMNLSKISIHGSVGLFQCSQLFACVQVRVSTAQRAIFPYFNKNTVGCFCGPFEISLTKAQGEPVILTLASDTERSSGQAVTSLLSLLLQQRVPPYLPHIRPRYPLASSDPLPHGKLSKAVRYSMRPSKWLVCDWDLLKGQPRVF